MAQLHNKGENMIKQKFIYSKTSNKFFNETSQTLYEQTGLYIEEVISMIRGLEKKVEHQQQEINKLYSLDIIQNYSKYRRAE
jgi:hypothetical protein